MRDVMKNLNSKVSLLCTALASSRLAANVKQSLSSFANALAINLAVTDDAIHKLNQRVNAIEKELFVTKNDESSKDAAPKPQKKSAKKPSKKM